MLAVRQRAAYVARRARPTTILQSRTYASETTPPTDAAKAAANHETHSKDDHGHHDHGHGDHGHEHHGHNVEEPLGTALYLAVGIVPASGILYYASRPGEDGAQPRITQWIDSFQLDALKKWEERTQIHTKLIEQAAHDRHLFFYADTKPHIELKSPEMFQHGSPRNVPAGHYINLDHVTEHYRNQYLAEEARKADLMAAKKE